MNKENKTKERIKKGRIMILYFDKRIGALNFGMHQVKKALQTGYVEKHITDYDMDETTSAIIVRFSTKQFEPSRQVHLQHPLMDEGFEILKTGQVVIVQANEAVGCMYGLFEVAEMIHLHGVEGITEKVANPYHTIRGVKHNLPYEPYDNGDPFEKNRKTMMDTSYWKQYIEMLALNRYNTLSLWSENPFPMMFKLSKYPETCPYSDEEMHHFENCFHFIFRYAKELGINTYLITWNIRITPAIAQGLGLPIEIGTMKEQYDIVRDVQVAIPNSSPIAYEIREKLPIIKDYFIACIETLCTKYTLLSGLGTTSSEEMSGTTKERVHWVKEAYLEGIKRSGRHLPFIFRTNSTATAPIINDFMKDYDMGDKYLSWKYSNAHMYSAEEPMFEQVNQPWKDMNLEGMHIIYTVRNDDFHTFRGGSYPFIQAYIQGMKRNKKAVGFYWGADGYVWGKDFQHVPFKHMDWKYDFEKHWYEFMLLGRLVYDPQTKEDIFISEFNRHYTEKLGLYYYQGTNEAMNIIAPFQRTNWINYDFESHPESLLTAAGFRSVIDFMDREAMPGVGTLSINDTALGVQKDKEDTEDCIHAMENAVAAIDKNIEAIGKGYQKTSMEDK